MFFFNPEIKITFLTFKFFQERIEVNTHFRSFPMCYLSERLYETAWNDKVMEKTF